MARPLHLILTFLATVSLAWIGSCYRIRSEQKQHIRSSLPLQYQDGHFVRFDVCNHFFVGGGSYIFKLSSNAAKRLRSDEMNAKIEPLGPRVKWDREGMPGLMCLQGAHHDLMEYFENSMVYARPNGTRHVDYFIPAAGLIVGGIDPR